jgi:hypothetical protein
MKQNITLILALTALTHLGIAQTQHSAYTAIGKGVATTYLTDYQAIGINASALGWIGLNGVTKKTTMGSLEFAFGIASPELNSERLSNATNSIIDRARGNNAPLDFQKQLDAAGDFAEAGIAINADLSYFGISYQDEKLGGIGIAVRENYNWFSQLNETTSDIVFRGQLSSIFDSLQIAINGDTSLIANGNNISNDTLAAVIAGRLNNPILLSELTEGSSIKFNWNREFNIGYGRKILGNDSTLAIYGGVGARFIQSVAHFDFESNENGMTMTSALSPTFGILYSDPASNPSAVPNNNNFIPSLTGTGYGIDFAGSAILLNRIRIAAAVNNIGSVTYNRNVYTIRDTLIGEIATTGLDNYDITQSLDQLLNAGGLFNLTGTEDLVVPNSATFRFGGSMDFSKKLSAGIDIVAPFNRDIPGSIANPVLAIGGDFRPFDWLQLSTGYFGGGIYKNNIPVGINFILKEGAYEFGVASRDAISFFTDNANSLSFAMGFARFRF